MTSNSLRREVLSSFKKLHRTSQLVFKNNAEVSARARREINDSYRKNMSVTDVNSIKDQVKFAHEVAYELKASIVELKPTEHGTYSLSAISFKTVEGNIRQVKHKAVKIIAVEVTPDSNNSCIWYFLKSTYSNKFISELCLRPEIFEDKRTS